MNLQCPTCDADVSLGHRAHRGLLINAIASLDSGLLLMREQLVVLEKSGHRAKNQAKRDRNMRTLLELQTRVIRDTGLLADLKKANEGCYG